MNIPLRSGPIEFGPAIALNGRKPEGIKDYTFVRVRKFGSTEWFPEPGMAFKDNKVWGNIIEIQLQAGSPDYANFPDGKAVPETVIKTPAAQPAPADADPVTHVVLHYLSGKIETLPVPKG